MALFNSARLAFHNFRVAEWTEDDNKYLSNWFNKQVCVSEQDDLPEILHPSVAHLKDLIEKEPKLFMLFNGMFNEVPLHRKMYMTVKNWHHMIHAFNKILTLAPAYDKSPLVGFPINAILNWPMATESGFAAFLDERVNRAIKWILDDYGAFLKSPASLKYVTENADGWLGKEATEKLGDVNALYNCNPSLPHWGFASFDDFFTRTFRTGVRPVEYLDDDNIINNACESGPYKLVHGTELTAEASFWIKSQPYSLRHILIGDPVDTELYKHFVHGTLYQAFLSAANYHRWHSPINGTVLRSWIVPGTYYSEAPYIHSDTGAPNESQGYISHVATRSITLLQADNPKIGLMAFVAIGMAEVSSCEVTAREGQHVRKGEELGMFHFGGSTHLLIFGPHVKLEFALPEQPSIHANVYPINKKLAVVKH